MKIQTGYIYHIKDEFFNKINGNGLMINHENGKSRPSYFTIKDKDILWFIPLSSKVQKYESIINKKVKKFGVCRSIMIRKIAGRDSVILLQNAFPTLEKYVNHPHIINGVQIKAVDSIKIEILNNFKYLLALKSQGRDLFFTDIDGIKKIMLEEAKKLNCVDKKFYSPKNKL